MHDVALRICTHANACVSAYGPCVSYVMRMRANHVMQMHAIGACYVMRFVRIRCPFGGPLWGTEWSKSGHRWASKGHQRGSKGAANGRRMGHGWAQKGRQMGREWASNGQETGSARGLSWAADGPRMGHKWAQKGHKYVKPYGFAGGPSHGRLDRSVWDL